LNAIITGITGPITEEKYKKFLTCMQQKLETMLNTARDKKVISYVSLLVLALTPLLSIVSDKV